MNNNFRNNVYHGINMPDLSIEIGALLLKKVTTTTTTKKKNVLTHSV